MGKTIVVGKTSDFPNTRFSCEGYLLLDYGEKSNNTKAFTECSIWVTDDPNRENPQKVRIPYAQNFILEYSEKTYEWKVLSFFDVISKEVLEKIKAIIALQAIY